MVNSVSVRKVVIHEQAASESLQFTDHVDYFLVGA